MVLAVVEEVGGDVPELQGDPLLAQHRLGGVVVEVKVDQILR